MSKISVVGHSFVRRLQESIQQDSKEDFAQISFHGRSGFMADDILKSYRPSGEDFLILDVGTNDLVNKITGDKLATIILEFCKYFKEINSNLRKIYVLEIVDRVKTRAVSRNEFRREKDFYNERIGEIAGRNDFIKVVKQDLSLLDIRDWSRDGIHPDTKLGKTTYKKTIKNVLRQIM